jgi:hypothetical protein
MTPKEKAKELLDKFYQRFPLKMDVITTRGDLSWEYDNWEEAKQCALIAVDEILNSKPYWEAEQEIKYWENVKQEIKDL